MYTRYVALGDSQTEGLWDGDDSDGIVGFADRLAVMLDDQLPQALAMRPDLVSVCVGMNDITRPGLLFFDRALADLDLMYRAPSMVQPDTWSNDRVHGSTKGHILFAAAAAEALDPPAAGQPGRLEAEKSQRNRRLAVADGIQHPRAEERDGQAGEHVGSAERHARGVRDLRGGVGGVLARLGQHRAHGLAGRDQIGWVGGAPEAGARHRIQERVGARVGLGRRRDHARRCGHASEHGDQANRPGESTHLQHRR